MRMFWNLHWYLTVSKPPGLKKGVFWVCYSPITELNTYLVQELARLRRAWSRRTQLLLQICCFPMTKDELLIHFNCVSHNPASSLHIVPPYLVNKNTESPAKFGFQTISKCIPNISYKYFLICPTKY
jgi:hypothetical protein